MIKAVVFDLDDTLYPEYDYVISGFKKVAVKIGRDFNINDVDVFESLIALFEKSQEAVFKRFLNGSKLFFDIDGQNAYEKVLVDEYRSNDCVELQFFPDVIPFLCKLNKRNIKTGIITDGRVEGQEAKLRALRCNEYFDKVIITDALAGITFRKPHSLAFEVMAGELNVNLSEMAYIGDNPSKDFYIKQKEVFTIRIMRLKSLKENCTYYQDIKENIRIHDLMELCKII